jgi:outer membrane protein assembly factor BamB
MALAEGARPQKPLRVWPGVVLALALVAARIGVKAVVPGFTGFARGMMWSFYCAGAVLLWWLLLSRARWFERLGGVAVIAGGLYAAWTLRHPSMGPLWIFGYGVPGVALALVAGAVAARQLFGAPRRVVIASVVLLECLAWTLVRTEGISGDHVASFGWRFRPSAEERLLAQATPEPARPAAAAAPASTPAPVSGSTSGSPVTATIEAGLVPSGARSRGAAAAAPAPAARETTAPPPQTADAWPGFRGPGRDGVARGVRIATDWAASPPVELWRRAVGPGWSSFAVSGPHVYTQEQRGEEELVACYDRATGEPVWTHRDHVRFFESNGGAGPRGTPTLADGRVYAFGATGIVNALDASDGAVVWSHDAAADSPATESMGDGSQKIPDWGFSSSPLVVGDLVVVAVAGQLVAFDRATGAPRWTGPKGGVSYSSPVLATIGGVPQVLLMSANGLVSVAPADGRTLWEHKWHGFPIVQPAVEADGTVLVAAASDSGTRRLLVAPKTGGWSVEERWTSPALKPYFNDFVVHEGHAYGFDGRILACIDLADGRRAWKGGRYGNGQLVLLPEQGLLLVLSDEGELALVKAAPDAFTELGRVKALDGKTWNHPALAGDVLLVRNGAEMVAYRLPLAAPLAELARPVAEPSHR